MSWLNNLDSKLTITTGDGKAWPSLYVKSKRAREFNTAEFNYVNVSGTDVQRRLPKAHRYPLEIIFEGDTCITDALSFDNSAADPNKWSLQHPIYGRITGQPLDLSIDNSTWNVSRVSVTFVETGSGVTPIVADAPAQIQSSVFLVTQQYSDLYSTEIVLPPTSALQQMTAQVNSAYAAIASQIASATDATAFLNAYNDANTLINNTVFDTAQLVGQVQQISLLPITFTVGSVERVRLIGLQFATLFTESLLTAIAAAKGVYEFNAGTSLLSMCSASITNYLYNTRDEVIGVISTLTDSYNAYISNLDALQATNGSAVGAYLPQPTTLGGVADLVNFTVATLYSIAERAKQVRVVELPEDAALVPTVFKYYGLDAADSTIDIFIAINSIGIKELPLLRKGRKIIYFV